MSEHKPGTPEELGPRCTSPIPPPQDAPTRPGTGTPPASPSSSEVPVGPASLPSPAHSPDPGDVAGLAMHLEHPAMVGKQQLQGLAEKEDASGPDPRGENGHAEKCLGLRGLVEAAPVRGREGCWGPLGASLGAIMTVPLMPPELNVTLWLWPVSG